MDGTQQRGQSAQAENGKPSEERHQSHCPTGGRGRFAVQQDPRILPKMSRLPSGRTHRGTEGAPPDPGRVEPDQSPNERGWGYETVALKTLGDPQLHPKPRVADHRDQPETVVFQWSAEADPSSVLEFASSLDPTVLVRRCGQIRRYITDSVDDGPAGQGICDLSPQASHHQAGANRGQTQRQERYSTPGTAGCRKPFQLWIRPLVQLWWVGRTVHSTGLGDLDLRQPARPKVPFCAVRPQAPLLAAVVRARIGITYQLEKGSHGPAKDHPLPILWLS